MNIWHDIDSSRIKKDDFISVIEILSWWNKALICNCLWNFSLSVLAFFDLRINIDRIIFFVEIRSIANFDLSQFSSPFSFAVFCITASLLSISANKAFNLEKSLFSFGFFMLIWRFFTTYIIIISWFLSNNYIKYHHLSQVNRFLWRNRNLKVVCENTTPKKFW